MQKALGRFDRLANYGAMAKKIDEETISGDTQVYRIVLQAEDNATPSINAVAKYLQDLAQAYRKVGRTAEEALGGAMRKLTSLRANERIGDDTYQRISNFLAAGLRAAGPEGAMAALNRYTRPTEANEEAKAAARAKGRVERAALEQTEDLLVALGKLTIAAYALVKPFKEAAAFAGEFQKLNIQLDLLARGAATTAQELRGMGAPLARFGGGDREAAATKRAFELEMDRRRRGLSDGGRYTAALASFGINFDPNSFERTRRLWAEWFSRTDKSEAEKQSAGATLGLSGAEIAAYSRGVKAIQDDANAVQGYTKNTKEATKAAEELAFETYKMQMAWRDLKDGIAIDILPLIKSVTGYLAKLGAALNNDVGRAAVRTIVAIGAVVSTLTVLVGVINKVVGIWQKLITLMKKTPVPTVPGDGGKAGGGKPSAGGRMPIPGPIGLALAAVDTLGGAIQRGSMDFSLGELAAVVTRWSTDWHAFINGLGRRGELTEKQRQFLDSDAAARGNWLAGDTLRQMIGGRGESQKLQQVLSAAEALLLASHVSPTLASPQPYPTASSASYTITGGLNITVQSDNADPSAVAEEVHRAIIDEFGVLADRAGAIVA